ncbi:hypothetical protein BV20DRAFT_968661 [Pilatotrama ljubarskyi]|nr:hypothetical protein BV20DRAFT_968661 [Pilatotrama ljubarskyi]
MGVSKPVRGRLPPDEIATIKDAHLDVPVVVDTYEIILTDEERAMAVPPDLRQRVGGTRYTWAVYIANSVPDPRVGVKGDIWIDSRSAKKRIFYQGDRNAWDVAGWDLHDHRNANPRPMSDKTSLKDVAIYHPWLQHRRLEFDGARLQWGIVDRRWSLYMGRLNKQVKAAGWPKYADIPLWRVAEHLCTAELPSVWRTVVPRSSQPSAAQAPDDPPVPGPSPPVVLPVLRFDLFSSAKRAFPPPGITSPNSSFRLSTSAAQASTDVPVKTEEEEEGIVLEQLKRVRDSASASPAPEQGSKRARVGEPGTTPVSMSISPAPNSPTSQPSLFFGPAAALRLPGGATGRQSPDVATTDIDRFLRTLSPPLPHCEHALKDLGIASIAYLESFAAAPESLLSQFTAKLQEQGLKFMEALILRTGLGTLRPKERMGERPSASPNSVKAFLSALRPSMAQHAELFEELGVDTVHLPILAQLDAAPYAEFEQTLRSRGLSWADCFLIKVALKTRIPT